MIDRFSDWFVKWLIHKNILKQEQYSNYDYYLRIFLFNFIIISLVLFVGFIFHCLKEVIIISIVFNILRVYSGGFHTNLDNCMKITIIYISLISVLTKYLSDYYLILFIIAFFTGVYIIKIIPKINEEFKEYEDDYYRSWYINLLLFFYIVSILGIQYKIDYIVSSISMGIISTSILVSNLGMKIFEKIDRVLSR